MTRDVVIVGGGIAGLAAAWRLRHRDVLLLEAEDRLGGRLHSEPCGDHWLNYGAHLFPGPGSTVDGMLRGCGLTAAPVWGSMMGLAVGQRRLTRGRVETYPLRLPLGARDRIALAAAGVRVQRAVARYRRVTTPAPGETPAAVRARALAFEGDRSFGELLGSLPPAVERIFACAAHRATAELSELSGGCGPGSVVGAGEGGRAARPGARHVVMAAQAPFAAPLVAPVAADAAAALERMTYGPFLVVAVRTTETTVTPWDRVYAMATPGRAFDMFTNQAHVLHRHGDRRSGGSLMLFAGGHGAAALSREPDPVIVDRFLADLHDLYPQTRGLVGDARVCRWPLGNVYAHPGRHRLQGPLEGPLGPHGNLHLAGDYFAELGNMEATARTGVAAAERIDADLRGAPHD